jgi:phosphohistidine swiveling domain-containing protein
MEIIACGLGVSKGKIQGIVRVVTGFSDLSTFNETDILVTRLTNPTMVPMMNKAAGIICDIGGLTSHPSIVSRELGIPCIVSAKNVNGKPITQILSDGQRVEMNGTTGEIFLLSHSLDWIDAFIESCSAAVGNIDLGTIQPYDWLQFEPLFAKEFIAKVDEFVRKAKEKGISPREFASLWPTTTGLRVQIYYLLLQLKCLRVSEEKRMGFLQFFFEMLQARAVDDIHGNVSNICQTKEEIDLIFKTLSFTKGTPEGAKTLGKCYNALYNLCAGIYLDFYLDSCAENEGPYDVSHIYGDGHILVIKKFVNMLTPFWKELNLPCNDVQIYCIYKEVHFSCDMVSVHSVYEGDVINGLVDYAVVVDGNIVDVDAIKKLLDVTSMLSVEQWQRMQSLSVDEQKLKGLYVKCFGMKKLFEKVGIDWEPSTAMKEAIKQPFKDNLYWNVPEYNQKEYWRKMLDPRIDFYPADIL